MEVSNRFEALTDADDEDVQTTYDALVNICSHAAESVLPKRKKRSEQWVTLISKKLLEERNQAKLRYRNHRNDNNELCWRQAVEKVKLSLTTDGEDYYEGLCATADSLIN